MSTLLNRKFTFIMKENNKKVSIVLSFPFENIWIEKPFTVRSTLTLEIFIMYVDKMVKQNFQKINFTRPLIRFVKDERRYIAFQKLKQQPFNELLQKQMITVEYLYKNKRDELNKTLSNFDNQVQEKHKFMVQISKDYEQKSKYMILRKLASTKSGLQTQSNLDIKIRISLLISDPLARNKQIPISHQQLDIEEHIKILRQASNSAKSLIISVEKYYAFDKKNTMDLVFGDYFRKVPNVINIVHFFTSLVRKNGQLYIVFQESADSLGQQKLVKVKDFFQRQQIREPDISILIFIGHNVNLLKDYLPKSLKFSVLLLSTYSPNSEQTFQFFLKSFYQSFFNRIEPQQSMKLASEEFKKKFIDSPKWKNVLFCCCHHEHDDNCAWTKIVQKVGIKISHKMFYHKILKTRGTSVILNYKNQKSILNNVLSDILQFKKCASEDELCCKQSQESHTTKQKILQKMELISSDNYAKLFVLSNSSDFVKNQFHTKISYDKMSQVRRCPLILAQIVQKILVNRGKIVEFIGNRKVGKSYFIQAACRYIHYRKPDYIFENIDINQGTLQQCIKNMYSKARRLKADKKKIVFIHNNSSMEFQKQFLQYFKKNNSNNLPFTFLVKIAGYQNQLRSSISSHSTIPLNNLSTIYLHRLQKIDIICEVYHQIKDQYFEDSKNLQNILVFANRYQHKLSYRLMRSFLRYFRQNWSNSWMNKSLQSVYQQMSHQFNKKMEKIQLNNKNLFEFIGFISQFHQGIYFTKLNMIILKQVFEIQDIKFIIKNKQNSNFFEVIQKNSFVKSTNIKSQKIDFILPDDKVINYFKQSPLLQKRFQLMKHNFFYYFFNVIQSLVFQNINIVRKKLKKQRNFLDQGIFIFHKHHRPHYQNQQDKIIKKILQDIQRAYGVQVDIKILYQTAVKQKFINNLNDTKIKQKLLKEKILIIVFHQSERYVLHRHLSAIANLISKNHMGSTMQKREYIKKQFTNQEEKIDKSYSIHKFSYLSKCPIVFYKRILLVYKLLLRESEKYQQIQKKLNSICPSIKRVYQQKGSKILQQLISRNIRSSQKNKITKNKMHRSFAQINQTAYNQFTHTNQDLELNASSYFQKLISFIQIEILLQKRESFSLSFGQNGGRRKTINSLNNQKATYQKNQFERRIQNLLPVISRQTKSEHFIHHKKSETASDTELQLGQFNEQGGQQLRQISQQELIIMLLKKMIAYESQEYIINYFNDHYYILSVIKRQINLFVGIIDILEEMDKRAIQLKYVFLETLTKEELIMQILRLHMRKIQIHFKISDDQNAISSSITSLLDLKNIHFPFQQYQKQLRQSFNDVKSFYYQDQKIDLFLKNTKICQNYIRLVCGNAKVTEEFTTSIGEVDTDYKELFSFLCQQTWKKMLFNQSNNIIFFKSRVMIYQREPYSFVRKRNVTMKYIMKLLSDMKINITFLHLTTSNFNYIQIDKKQNPNCRIKYLVLTVDSIVVNGELYILFEQNKNILEQPVAFDSFFEMLSKVNVQFIIIMGKKAIDLAQRLNSKRLKNHPVILGFESPDFGLDNFIEYQDPDIIEQKEEAFFTGLNQKNLNQTSFNKRIYRYLDIECYHCLLDMIICTLVTNLAKIGQVQRSPKRKYNQQTQGIPCTYKKVDQIISKSINLAKQIMRTKWQASREIQIKYKILLDDYQTDYLVNLRRNSSLSTGQSHSELTLLNRISSRDYRQSCQFLKYFPIFQQGKIINNTKKLFESPDNLYDEEYYENVGRNQELFWIMSFIQNPGRNIVEISGHKGAGKSSFLRQILWINQTYRLFKDGVYIFDVKNLSKNCQTLMQHIQIFFKEDKLFTVLQSKLLNQKFDVSTILVGLDNLDESNIKENQDFLNNIKGKPINIIYTSSQKDIGEQLQTYLKVNVFEIQSSRRKHIQNSKLININFSLLMKKKSSNTNNTNGSNSPTELQQIPSLTQSVRSQISLSSSQQVWNMIKVDVNSIGKHALFCIALSYLKKQQLSDLRIGLKQFISKHYSYEVARIMRELVGSHHQTLPKRLNSFGSHRLSQSGTSSSQFQQKDSQKCLQIPKATSLHKTKSSISSKGLHECELKINENQFSKVQKLRNSLDQYFKKLSEQKIDFSTSMIEGGRLQKLPMFISSTKNRFNSKQKDTRLWFYQDCFEQLILRNNSYDQLKITFR